MVTIKERLDCLEKRHGGANAAADFLDIDRAYWSRLKSGKKSNPSVGVLDVLGLVKVVRYELKRE